MPTATITCPTGQTSLQLTVDPHFSTDLPTASGPSMRSPSARALRLISLTAIDGLTYSAIVRCPPRSA
jgi:hypothetical protein